MHLSRSDKTVDSIVKAAFPDYTGNKIQTDVYESVKMYNTNWDGGSKRDYVVVQLSTMKAIKFEDCPHGMIDDRTIKIEPGYIIAVRQFSGMNQYIYLYSSSKDITPSLTQSVELSRNEMIVLVATRSLKSSYAGISNYRFHEANRETGISAEDYDSAKANLISKGYLNKAGAITVSGKNVVGMKYLFDFKK